MNEPSRTAHARPGDLVRFECADCEEIYRQTIQPRRDVARALLRLGEGHTARAVELLEMALTDLERIAEFMNERQNAPDPGSTASIGDPHGEVPTEAQ
jgi:hypothetical protein